MALLVSDTRYLYRLCNNSSGIAGFDMRYLYSLHNSSGDTTVFVLSLFFCLCVPVCACVRACVRARARAHAFSKKIRVTALDCWFMTQRSVLTYFVYAVQHLVTFSASFRHTVFLYSV